MLPTRPVPIQFSSPILSCFQVEIKGNLGAGFCLWENEQKNAPGPLSGGVACPIQILEKPKVLTTASMGWPALHMGQSLAEWEA